MAYRDDDALTPHHLLGGGLNARWGAEGCAVTSGSDQQLEVITMDGQVVFAYRSAELPLALHQRDEELTARLVDLERRESSLQEQKRRLEERLSQINLDADALSQRFLSLATQNGDGRSLWADLQSACPIPDEGWDRLFARIRDLDAEWDNAWEAWEEFEKKWASHAPRLEAHRDRRDSLDERRASLPSVVYNVENTRLNREQEMLSRELDQLLSERRLQYDWFDRLLIDEQDFLDELHGRLAVSVALVVPEGTPRTPLDIWLSEAANWHSVVVRQLRDAQRWFRDRRTLDARLDKVNADIRQWNRNIREQNADIERLNADRIDWVLDADRHLRQSFKVTDAIRQRLVHAIDSKVSHRDGQVRGLAFEMACEDLLRAHRFAEVVRQGGADDGGVDIWANQISPDEGTLRTAIQCKIKGKRRTVGRNDVMLFHGNLSENLHHRAILMTFGRVEPNAMQWGSARGIEFWDGQRVCEMMIVADVGLDLYRDERENLAVRLHDAYWDELITRAQAEHEKQKRKKS